MGSSLYEFISLQLIFSGSCLLEAVPSIAKQLTIKSSKVTLKSKEIVTIFFSFANSHLKMNYQKSIRKVKKRKDIKIFQDENREESLQFASTWNKKELSCFLQASFKCTIHFDFANCFNFPIFFPEKNLWISMKFKTH